MAGAKGPGVREANLADVLRLVHVDGPLSRAALTRHTGLNRSTIADLVSALAGAGLVVEHDPRPSRRVGRPSPVVVADPRVVVAAANPEVDALTVAVVGLDRGIRAQERLAYDAVPTPQRTAEMIAEQLRRWRRDVLRDTRPKAVGVAVPGLVRASDGLVRVAPHLGWADVAFGELVRAVCDVPAVVGNDANLGVLAEHLFGAARGTDDVVYLNGGAGGIGGGIVIGGMPVTGARGYAGEFGHRRAVAVDADRRSAGGTLEEEVSRARLEWSAGMRVPADDALADVVRRAHAAQAGRRAAADAAVGAGGAAAGVAGVAVGAGDAAVGAGAAAVGARDAVVVDETARQRRILAAAVADIAGSLNPAVVVLGGFLAIIVGVDLSLFAADVRRLCAAGTAEPPDIRLATLAADRLLIGAAEAAFAPLLAAPLSV